MDKIQNKYIITIPQNTQVFYSEKKKIIILKGSLKTRILFKLKVKLLILETQKLIKVTTIPINTISSNEKKKIKAIQGTTTALIRQLLIETSTIFYKKLKIVGVGYKAFDVDNYKEKLLLFRLGYSHPLYFRISEKLNMFCLKSTKLFVYGSSYSNVSQITSLIRSKKTPEPYKGKGILYENENITLKEGKKN